jgi:hypothetical protein
MGSIRVTLNNVERLHLVSLTKRPRDINPAFKLADSAKRLLNDDIPDFGLSLSFLGLLGIWTRAFLFPASPLRCFELQSLWVDKLPQRSVESYLSIGFLVLCG